MKLSNKTYDFLKWFALAFIPAFVTLVLTLGDIWSIPYYVQIGATVSAIGVFIAGVLGISTKNYNKEINDESENN